MNIFKLVIFLCFLSSNIESQIVVKFATIAPEGTNWTKILRDFAKDVEQQTFSKVKFKIYTNGVQGDEKDVIRKIKSGQLNASGFTGYGIGEIAKEIRVLEAPFLFKGTDEIDYIYKKFGNDFRKIFEEKGFVLLGWAEIGNVYVLSKKKIEKISDFKNTRLWIWEGDFIALKTFKNFGASPIPLSISDVMTSIQTGMIDTVYATPASIIPLGWHKKMEYLLDLPITYGIGAVLISKQTLDLMDGKTKEVFLSLSDKYFSHLNSISRKDNEKGIEMLKNQLKVIKPSDVSEFEKIAKKTRDELKSFYGDGLLEKIEHELEVYRVGKRKTNKN